MRRQNCPMEYTLEYMERLFYSIKHKKTESYVIHRIWDRLDDPRIEFVAQQRITLPDENYALADLYLPQLGIFVEINEPFHGGKKEEDYKRNDGIVKQTHFDQRIIECGSDSGGWRTLQDIHQQIDDCVAFIKYRIATAGRIISSGEKQTVRYLRSKRVLCAETGDALRTIDDICELTGAIAKHLGFLRAGGANFPKRKDSIVWFPNLANKAWNNVLNENDDVIYEAPKDFGKCESHVASLLSDHCRRITFVRQKNALGMTAYYFKGIYELDEEATQRTIGSNDGAKAVWRRIAKEYDLETENHRK